jgi:hypothetical protein
MDYFMSASTIQFVSTNLTNRFEQIGVSARVLNRSDGSRHRRRIPLPNGTKSMDPLELTAWERHELQVAQQLLVGGDQGLGGSENGFRRRRCRWGRVDVGFGVACCNTMSAEHRLRQRIDLLSGSTKMGAGSDIDVCIYAPRGSA